MSSLPLILGWAAVGCTEASEGWQMHIERDRRALLGEASYYVQRVLDEMNERSTSCSCGSRRYENHKEHLAAQEMRAILARIEKVKNKLAEMTSKED